MRAFVLYAHGFVIGWCVAAIVCGGRYLLTNGLYLPFGVLVVGLLCVVHQTALEYRSAARRRP